MKAYPTIPLFALATIEYVLAASLPHQACTELAARYPSQLFFPDSLRYVNESNSKTSTRSQFPRSGLDQCSLATAKHDAALWAKNCVLSPWCVFTPNTAKDVAEGLAIIRKTSTHFSVRGAGHMPVSFLNLAGIFQTRFDHSRFREQLLSMMES